MIKNFLKKACKVFVKLIAAFFTISILLVILYRFINPCITLTMLARKTEALFTRNKSSVIQHQWKDYEDISPYMTLAIITAEDQKFAYHSGFDFEAIEKAVTHNKKVKQKKRKRIRGASTISQQTAKNVFLWQGKSYFRKALEAYFTVLIELFWGKKRIIEVYMNVAETGDMIFGVEAAARHYFRKPASQLTKYEAAVIAVILPNPRKYSATKPGPYLQTRISWCMNMMDKLGGKNYLQQIQ